MYVLLVPKKIIIKRKGRKISNNDSNFKAKQNSILTQLKFMPDEKRTVFFDFFFFPVDDVFGSLSDAVLRAFTSASLKLF